MASSEVKYFYYLYDLDATTYKYGRVGDAAGGTIQGKYGLSTVGSSTTVTASGGNAFDPVKVGDILSILKNEVRFIRKVTAKASATSITVDSAIDLSSGNIAWWFWPFTIGTAIENGWHYAGNYQTKRLEISAPTIQAAGGLDVQIEIAAQNPNIAYESLTATNYPAASSVNASVDIPGVHAWVRAGVKGGSGFGGTDAITVQLVGVL